MLFDAAERGVVFRVGRVYIGRDILGTGNTVVPEAA